MAEQTSEQTITLAHEAYAAAGQSREANLALAVEIITVRTDPNPNAQVNRTAVAEMWKRAFPADQTGDDKTYNPAVVTSVKNAVRYMVRVLEGTQKIGPAATKPATAKSTATPSAASTAPTPDDAPIVATSGADVAVQQLAEMTRQLAEIQSYITSPRFGAADYQRIANGVSALGTRIAELAKLLRETKTTLQRAA